MKVLKNKIIVYLLVLSFSFMSIFNFSVSSYCDSVTVGANQYYWDNINKFFVDMVGIIFNDSSDDGPSKHSLTSHYSKKLAENNDSRSVDEFINDNVTINGDNIEVGRDLYVYMNDFANDYLSKQSYVYGYTGSRYCWSSHVNLYSNRDCYLKISDIIKDLEDNQFIYFGNLKYYPTEFYKYTLCSNSIEFVKMSINSKEPRYYIEGYDNWSDKVHFIQERYVWSSSLNDFNITTSDYSSSPTYLYGYLNENNVGTLLDTSSVLITNEVKQYKIFNSVSAMKNDSVGIQPYYVTNTYNSDSSTISGSYNTTTSKIDNSITYGDVNNYINNYYNDPNNYDNNNQPLYPSTNDIYIYINNYQPEPSNPSGGGSSGGGNSGDSDSGDSSWNWGWLGKVGEFLGGLISAIGEIIAGLLDGILSIFTALTQDLPTLFNDLLGGLLSWLPPEITALITLSITFAVIVFVIRIIRG